MVKPVSRATWPDMECLFASRGGPHYCWCMLWRPKPRGFQAGRGPVRRERLKGLLWQCVDRADPIGLLGYLEGEPVGWVSVAPRSSYRPLGDAATTDSCSGNVWSIVCFYVRRRVRGQGLCRRLACSAVDYAKAQGADLVEAYPADSDSPSYSFMGRAGMFLELGFEPVGKAGARRTAMRLKIY